MKPRNSKLDLIVGLSALFLILLPAFFQNKNKTVESPQTIEEHFLLTSKIKEGFVANFSQTTWFSSVKNISVKIDGTVEVYTDLVAHDEKGSRICGAVSSLFYLK